MDRDTIIGVLSDHGLPIPDGELVRTRWVARYNDWYVETADGWLWFDADSKTWKPCPYGPL